MLLLEGPLFTHWIELSSPFAKSLHAYMLIYYVESYKLLICDFLKARKTLISYGSSWFFYLKIWIHLCKYSSAHSALILLKHTCLLCPVHITSFLEILVWRTGAFTVHEGEGAQGHWGGEEASEGLMQTADLTDEKCALSPDTVFLLPQPLVHSVTAAFRTTPESK